MLRVTFILYFSYLLFSCVKGTHKWRISLLCATTVFCCVHDSKLLESWIQGIFGQASFNITQPHPPTQGPSRETAFCYFFLLLFKPINDHKFSAETDSDFVTCHEITSVQSQITVITTEKCFSWHDITLLSVDTQVYCKKQTLLSDRDR